MKKIYLYTVLLATAFTFAACDTEDFNSDWANPQAYDQEAQQGKVNGTIVAATDSIDLNNVGDNGVAVVTFAGAQNATEGSTVTFTSLKLNGEIDVPFTTQGNDLYVTTEDLTAAIQQAYASKAYTTRECKFTVTGDLVNAAGSAVLMPIQTNEVTIKVQTPELPSIANETAFYYVGTYNGWNLASPTEMTANGDGTYSCILDMTEHEEWFCFAPQSSVTAQNWGALFRAPSNGETATSGFLGDEINSNNSFCFKVEKAGKYKFTLDPKNWTYTYGAYVGSLYYAGDAYGWPAAQCKMGWNGTDFVGYYYVNTPSYGSFKFVSEGVWYGGHDGVIDGDGNISPDHAGFYQIVANMDKKTYSLTEIKYMSLIGSAVNGDSSWGTDYDLTFNASTLAWEGTFTMTDGEYKVRANHDWGTSWGGELNAMTSQNGANLKMTAGKYKFSFQPNCDGEGVLTVTAAE